MSYDGTTPVTPELIEELGKKFDLNQHTWRVMFDEPFFSALLRRIDRRKSLSCPTMAVYLNKDRGCFSLEYNPRWAAGIDDHGVCGVIMHELYHIIFEHVTRRQPPWRCGADDRPFNTTCKGCEYTKECNDLMKKYNVAADCAINSHLERNLPNKVWGKDFEALIPGKNTLKDVPPMQSMEWYVDYFNQNPELYDKIAGPDCDGNCEIGPGDGADDGKDGSGKPRGGNPGGGQFDDHSGWTNGEGADEDAATKGALANARAQFKKDVMDAINDIQKSGKGWGTVSAEMQKEILDRVRGKLPWKQIVRSFVGTSRRMDKHNTVKRINRRFPYMYSGSKHDHHARILVLVDMSGSVGDEMLAAFHGEMDSLAQFAEFTYGPFDTRVQEDEVFVWKKGQKGKGRRVLTGGTSFQNARDWAMKQGKFDAIMILTDLEAPQPTPIGVPCLWITDQAHFDHPYMNPAPERVIYIPDSDLKQLN